MIVSLLIYGAEAAGFLLRQIFQPLPPPATATSASTSPLPPSSAASATTTTTNITNTTSALLAPSLIETEPESVGMSSERLERLGHWLNEQVTSGRVAGCSVGVLRRNRICYAATSGCADIDAASPFDTDTIVRIYSMTKPIVSVAVMMLLEEGHFMLDDPVSDFAPCFDVKKMRVAVAGTKCPELATQPAQIPITWRHLLTHTAGLTYGFLADKYGIGSHYYTSPPVDFSRNHRHQRKMGKKDQEGRGEESLRPRFVTLPEMVERLANAPLLFEPGTAWQYSHATDVLGHLVSVVSGLPLDQFLRERIFVPLGMTRTGFAVPEEARKHFAACYKINPVAATTSPPKADKNGGAAAATPPAIGGGFMEGLARTPRGFTRVRNEDNFLGPIATPSGGGGLVSTLADYLTFCKCLMSGGAPLLSPLSVEYMLQNQLQDGRDLSDLGVKSFANLSMKGFGFGFGFAVVLEPSQCTNVRSRGEANWGGIASTCFWLDPRNDLACVFLTQLMPSSSYDFRQQLRSLVNAAVVAAG